MIVGIDSSNLGPGGSMTHLANLLEVARPSEHGIDRVVVWGGRSVLGRLPQRPWLELAHESVLDRALPWRLLWQRFRLPRLARACDVLFVPGGNALSRFRPFVTMSRNMLPFEAPERARYGWSRMGLRLFLLRASQARSFRRADGLIFLTEYAYRAVAGKVRLPGRIAVIPHGVEERFRSEVRPQRPLEQCSGADPLRLLYVSIVDVYKHQWHVARAVRALRDEGLPIAIDFVGGAYAPALARFERELKALDPAGDVLRYRGAMPFELLHVAHRDAEIFVFASSCENMPNILLEAMAAGLPIACARRGPMPEILGDAGIYFDPEQPAQIADAIRTLARDAGLRAEGARRASERARHYSWDRCASETLDFVADVARSSKAKAPQLGEEPAT